MVKKKEKLTFKNFVLLTIAGIVNAFGVVMFLYPVNLYDSGVSGLSMLLNQVTPPWCSLSLFLIVINIPIFLFGAKKQGLIFTVYSAFAVAIYSLTSFVIINVLPVDVVSSSPFAGTDLLLCAVFGGIISGIGSGLTIRFGGSIDGLDVLSVIFAKKIGITIGNFVLIFDTLLYIACGIVMHSWALPLYSIIAYFIGSKTVDFVVTGIDSSKCAMIVTNKSDKITKELTKNFQASGTIVEAIGGYSKEKKEIIYFNVNRFQINKLKKIVYSIDSSAYISIQNVSDIIKASVH